MKKISCIFLVVLLLITSSVPALASATPSNSDFRLEDYLDNYKKIPLPADNPGLGVVLDASVHTSSDSDIWIGDDGLSVVDFDDRLLSDDPFQTFAFSPLNVDVYADVNRRSDNKWLRVEKASWIVSGDAYLFSFPTINSQTERYGNIQFEIRKSMLPKPGKYGLEFTFKEGHLGTPGTGTAYTRLVSSGTNISPSHSQVKSSLEVSGTKYFVRSNVTIGYDTTGLSVFVTWPTSWNVSIQDCALFEDCFKFTFLEQAGAPSVSAPDASSGNGSAADYAANQAGQIAQNTAAMQDTLKEIVQTISKQLEALWNQQYNYIHLEDMANADKNADKIINNQNQNTEQITSSIDKHGNFIIDGLKGLFIPSDEFFKEYFDDLYNWFSDKFGFLTIPIDILVQILDVFTTSQKVDFIVTLPPLSIMGETVWPEQSFNFTDFMEKDFAFLITAIQTGTSILLILSFIDLCRKKYDEVMRN